MSIGVSEKSREAKASRFDWWSELYLDSQGIMCSSYHENYQKMILSLLNAEIRLWHIFLTFLHTVHLLSFLQWCNASKLKRCAQAAKDRTRWLKTYWKNVLFCRWKEHEVTNIARHPILELKDVLRLPLGDALATVVLIKCAAIWYRIGQHGIGFRFCSCDTRYIYFSIPLF